jgi:hypothetical protein
MLLGWLCGAQFYLYRPICLHRTRIQLSAACNRKATAMATKSERFPKKYFKAEDLKLQPLVLEIEEERLEEITDPKTGKAVEKSVVAFVETERKLVLNATNWDLIVEVTGCSDACDWPGNKIELFADKTSMAGSRVDCVRVREPGSGRPRKPALKAAPAPAATDDFDDEVPPLN